MIVEDWGRIDYESSVERQKILVDRVAGGGEDVLVLCTHPPVVTLGRGHVESDLTGWSGVTLETSRGGRATYHGPNQVILYPILNLQRVDRLNFRPRDVHAYLRSLEAATVAVLDECGLSGAEARTSRVGEISLTGVWIGERKVASIGIAVRKWVTYHGVAINVLNDPTAFAGIRPCGFDREIMTSVEAALGTGVAMDLELFRQSCANVFTKRLS